MRRRLAFAVLLMLPTFVVSAPGDSSAQWTIYDDFGGSLIDHARWFASQVSAGPPNPTTELGRVVTSGRLRMFVTQHGHDDSDAGTIAGVNRLNVTDPSGILGVRSSVVVSHTEAQGCALNSSATRARALLQGAWFNDGTSTGGGDRTGDIISGIQKMADSILGNVIQAFIVRCTNAACSAQASVLNQVFNTAWTLNRRHQLAIQHDPANDRFLYSVKRVSGAEETIELSYAGGLSDAAAPVVDFKHLAVNNSVANCVAGQRRGVMDALFDKVEILTP